MALLFIKDFTSSTVGVTPTGMTATTGTITVQTVSNAAGISGNTVTGLVSTSGANGDLCSVSGISAQADISIYLEQVVQYARGDGMFYLWVPTFRNDAYMTNPQNSYLIGRGQSPGPNSFHVYTKVNSSNYAVRAGGDSVYAYTPAVGDTVCSLTQCNGTTISYTVWKKGDPQPSFPDLTFMDSSVTAAGYAGLYLGSAGDSVSLARAPIATYLRIGNSVVAGNVVPGTYGPTSSNLVVSPPSGGTAPYTFQVYVNSQPGLDVAKMIALAGGSGAFATSAAAAATVAVPNMYPVTYTRVVYTDAGGTNAESVTGKQLHVMPAQTVSVLGIGGSTMAGTGASSVGTTDAFSRLGIKLPAILAPCNVVMTNRGQAGTTVADWQPGGSLLNGAITAANTAGATDVIIDLQINDARLKTSVSTWTTGITAIISGLQSGISTLKRVHLHKSRYVPPNGQANVYDENANRFVIAYSLATDGLVDNARVFAGDDPYNAFAMSWLAGINYFTDNFHCNDAGHDLMSVFWSSSFKRPGASPVASSTASSLAAATGTLSKLQFDNTGALIAKDASSSQHSAL